MKPIFLLPALCPALAAHATLLITEVNSNGTPGDFWELTNFGAAAVDLGGYVWTDDAKDPAKGQAVPAGTVVGAGESIVFVVAGSAESFRAAWGLEPSVQIVTGGPGLGKNDQVHLYPSASATTPAASLSYAKNGFTRSNGQASLGGHAGASAGGGDDQSLVWDPNHGTTSPRYTYATGGNFESWTATGGTQTGSPGRLGAAGGNSAPVFTGSNETYWRLGQALANSEFRVLASDADPGQTVTVSKLSGPAWLGVTPDGAGRWRLTGTPQAGRHEFTLQATDNAPGGAASTDRLYVLTVFPATAPVILNEYNAMANDVTPEAADPFFGMVPGNGGDWFELVVTGSGAAGSTVDMRGWKIDIHSDGGTETIVLSQDPYWATVMAGTLLTFIENNSAAGGLDTGINRVSARHTSGMTWSNVWIFDPIFVDQDASDFGNGIVIDHQDTRFSIRDADGVVVFGPAGEGVAHKDGNGNDIPDTLVGVNSAEVMSLREDPLNTVDPFFGRYRSESSSTFGAPNKWGSEPKTQSFSKYIRPNTPPVFTSTPPAHARGSYRYEITASDPNGGVPNITAGGLPDFLTLTPGPGGTAVLENNRPLTADDAGQHVIRLQVADAESATPQAYHLTVFAPQAAVIVNEYNAVAADKFINGGGQDWDDDGGALSVDSYFGRVRGNGGVWFELVVTGDGGPGLVDLRGWKIEVGTSRCGIFEAGSTLTLANHPVWQAVPAGTILTFTGSDSANGGLDTIFNIRNRRATHGDSWSNVWMGDPTHLVYTNRETNGYTIDGGVVNGVMVDSNDTQFRIIDAAGRIAFGPCGEGIAPLAGVSDVEIFELEDHPTHLTSPLDAAGLIEPGYDDGASGSTFGWPNEWHEGDGGKLTSQDFTRYMPARYDLWLEEHALDGDAAGRDADPDGDGRGNLHEYAFGGDPTTPDAAPAPGMPQSGPELLWSYLRRADDPALSFRHQFSTDLESWQPLAVEMVSSLPEVEMPGFNRVTLRCLVEQPLPPRWFVRAVAE